MIKGCLAFDPSERIKKEELLDHEFFREVVPVVGTTGTGKSTLASLMTGQHLTAGAGQCLYPRFKGVERIGTSSTTIRLPGMPP